MSATAAPPPRTTLRDTLALIRSDVRARRRYADTQRGISMPRGRIGMLLSPPVVGVMLYRLSHWLYGRHSRALAWMCWVLEQVISGIDITPESEIGPGFVVTHSLGVTIAAQVGANVIFHARACAGGRVGSDPNDASRYGVPVIGDGVIVGEAAMVMGRVLIGEGALIAAGALVMCDVPAGQGAAGHPAKVVPRDAVPWPLFPPTASTP